MTRYPLAISLLVSLLLHLAAITVVGPFWRHRQEARLFRARLEYAPRVAPRPRPVAPPSEPAVRMEYVPSLREPASLVDGAGIQAEPAPLEPGALPAPTGATVEIGTPTGVPSPGRPGAEPSPTGPARMDAAGMEARELLRVEDLARADDRRAVIIPDPHNRRDLRGFIHFTLLKMDGAGCDTGCSQLVGDLSRYMRDHTRLQARVRGTPIHYFLSEDLLKDPVHFLFQKPRLLGSTTERGMYMSDKETALLGRYLRGGGFVFAETPFDSVGNSPVVYTYFSELLSYIRTALEPDGRVVPLSFSHPVYHSFYSFPAGFPWEMSSLADDGPRPAWYYPKHSGTQSPRGLYGVEVDGELVAVLSDLGLHDHWRAPSGLEDQPPAMSTEVALRAGTNLVVYALTRKNSQVARRAAPSWEVRRPDEPVAELPDGASPGEGAVEGVVPASAADASLYADLPANLALVRSPLGDRLGTGSLLVVVDGGVRAEVLDPHAQAVVIRGLPPGEHQVRVTYGGRSARVAVDLQGGRTATLTFGLDRLLFLKRLRLRLEPRQLWLDRWLGRFSDLEVTTADAESYDDVAVPPAE